MHERTVVQKVLASGVFFQPRALRRITATCRRRVQCSGPISAARRAVKVRFIAFDPASSMARP